MKKKRKTYYGNGKNYKWAFWKGNKIGKVIMRRSNFKKDWADF